MDAVDLTDWELITQHLAGEAWPLKEIIRRYTPRLRPHLTRHLRQLEVDQRHAAIEDVLQDLWIRVDKFAPRLDQKNRFSTWLFTVATNLARNEHRRRRRAPERLPLHRAPDTKLLEEFDPPAPDSRTRPDLLCEQQDLIAKLRKFLAAHSPRENIEVLELREVQGYSYAEIASWLGIPVGTVRSRLCRVRKVARRFASQNK